MKNKLQINIVFLTLLVFCFTLASCKTSEGSRSIYPSREQNKTDEPFAGLPPGDANIIEKPLDDKKDDSSANAHEYSADSLQDFVSGVFSKTDVYVPVSKRQKPLGWVVDINNDNNDDGIFLCVKREAIDHNLEALSKDIRLYDDSFSPVELSVQVFRYLHMNEFGEPVFEKKQIPIGAYRVVKSFSKLELGEKFPFSYEVSVLTENSTIKYWIFLGNNISTFKLTDSPKKQTRITDIDSDGVTDIIIYDKVFEEGAGEETFLSWYRWNGREFEEYSSTNIVRNLNSFLLQVSNLTERQNWNRFIRYAFAKDVQQQLFSENIGGDAIVEHVFLSKKPEVSLRARDIKAVKFQEILENPFLDNNNQISIPCKITAGRDLYFFVKVKLADNPFIQPQYTLLWNSVP